MSKAIEVCKRNELWALIKKVSQHHGGDDVEELKAFAKDMVEKCTIDQALECFRDLASQCSIFVSKSTQNDTKTTQKDTKPSWYQLQPPFVKE